MTMTTNQPTVVDSGEFTVRRTIQIAAPIEKVWAAITVAEHIAKWFPQSAVLEPAAVGATGAFTFDGYDTIPVRVEEIDEPRMIAYRWSNDDALPSHPQAIDDEHSLLFRFTLEPIAGGTQLTVVETGFETTSDPAANMEDHRTGWDSELDELVAYLESSS